MNKKQSGPLFHISKRAALPWYRAWGIRALAIILALIVSALITGVTTGLDPLKIYATIFTGAFGTARKSWITAQNVAILLCISLAVTPAFKMRFWNIGAEGQVLIGCLATAACMICRNWLFGFSICAWMLFTESWMLGVMVESVTSLFSG